MSSEPLHLLLKRDGTPARGFLTPPQVLVGFCTTDHGAVIMEGKPPIIPPAWYNPFQFAPERYYNEERKGNIEPGEPEVFQGLFRAAHESLFEHKPEVLLGICDADFVTDSATMVQLFRVASQMYHQTPLVTTHLHLDLSVQVVNGKVFMKASYPSYGRFRRDATGQLVPPRLGFCERLRAMHAQCFKRATTYKLRTAGASAIPPYSILIQDDDLVEVLWPGVETSCVPHHSCRYHGAIAQHAVPVVLQDNQNWLYNAEKERRWADIMPRLYFAGCEQYLVTRYGANLGHGFWEGVGFGPVSRLESWGWGQHHPEELWSLANLLQWIHIRAQACASTYGRDTQFTVKLKAPSHMEHGGTFMPAYHIVAEKSETEERLVSEKDVEALCRWMTEPGYMYPSEAHPPEHPPIAYPPAEYAPGGLPN